VRHDAALSFRVHVSGTLIEDLGTRFSVHRKGDSTVVAVIEGLVQVSAEEIGTRTPSIPDLDQVPDVVVITKGVPTSASTNKCSRGGTDEYRRRRGPDAEKGSESSLVRRAREDFHGGGSLPSNAGTIVTVGSSQYRLGGRGERAAAADGLQRALMRIKREKRPLQ